MRKSLLFLMMVVAWALPHGAAVADENGEQSRPKVDRAWLEQTVQTCNGCHGSGGVSNAPNFPVIAGQHETYLWRVLQDYRDGRRRDAAMAAQVQNMSDAQLRALAAYYAAQDGPLYTPALK